LSKPQGFTNFSSGHLRKEFGGISHKEMQKREKEAK